MPASGTSQSRRPQTPPVLPRRPVSRRQLLGSLAPRRPNGSPPSTAASPQATAAPPGQGQGARWPGDPARLLVDRITFGFHLGEWELARSLGYRDYLEYQLDYESIDDSAMEEALADYVSLGMSAKEIYDTYWVTNQLEIPFYDLKYATLLRQIYSRRQLYERMVDFWSDHFSIDHGDDLCLILKTQDDRDVIRRHALGKFPDLLRASAKSPAMLQYLDNFANARGGPQENYARELMELHTLSVEGPYTEDDVKEVARCFTGWTFARNPLFPNFGKQYFSPGAHDPYAKTVLGQSIPPQGGESDGLTVLDLLAQHPSTARFVSTKLCRRFVADDPPADLVDRVTQTYLATGGEIKAMLREIFTPDAPAQFARRVRPKLRRPFHSIVSIVRALRLGSSDPLGVLYEGILQGHYPFGWHAPNGYPDRLEAWGNSLRPRWDFFARLLDGEVYGTPVVRQEIVALINGIGLPDKATSIDIVLTGGALDPRDVEVVRRFIDAAPQYTWRTLREAIALAASSPSFQFH